MSARTDAMLKASGHNGPILSTLESDDAAFVLTTDTLLFQHLGGVRRVTLRDLTRIHSDQDGLLHIETPAGTALTANLLGFEAADVQSFFTKVKEETARAKNAVANTPTPEAAAPTAAVARAFDAGTPAPPPPAPASSPMTPPAAAPQPQQQPQQPSKPPAPAAPAPSQPVVNTAETGPKIGWTTGAERKPPQPPAQPQAMGQPGLQPIAQAGHTAATPTAPTSPPIAPTVQTTPTSPPPSPQQPPPQAKPPTQPPTQPPTPVAQPPKPPTQPSTAQTVQTQAPLPPMSQLGQMDKGAAVAPTVSTAMLSRLTTEAKTADRAAGRLRILAIVLFVAALALAGTLIFSGQAFNGIWVLIAGGVGGVALLTVIDIIRLLVALAQTLGAEK